MSDDKRSVVERVADEMAAWIKDMRIGLPAEDPYSTQFGTVIRRELGQADRREGSTCSVVILDENYARETMRYEVTVSLGIEFAVQRGVGDGEDGDPLIDRVLRDLKRRALEYPRGFEALGGDPPSGVDVVLTGAERDPGDGVRLVIGGALYVDVLAFHDLRDPRLSF